MKRARLMTSVMSPREKTPHKATFWRLRSFKQFRMKNGRMNTVYTISVLDQRKIVGPITEEVSRPVQGPIDSQSSICVP
jgi:hypothetical protein